MDAITAGLVTGAITSGGVVAGEHLVPPLFDRAIRRQRLTGWHLQVTYPPGTPLQWRAPGPDDTTCSTPVPWSIELVEVRQHRAELSGTMWRIWSTLYERRWTFSARITKGQVINGWYAETRGDGGSGTFLL